MRQPIVTQPAELFRLARPDEALERGLELWSEQVGAAVVGGMGDARLITQLEDDVLATWPRDRVRGVVMRRTVSIGEHSSLSFQAGADPNRAWDLEIYVGNKRILQKRMAGGTEQTGGRKWENIKIDLQRFAGEKHQLRLYQRVLLPDKIAGNAYWKDLKLE